MFLTVSLSHFNEIITFILLGITVKYLSTYQNIKLIYIMIHVLLKDIYSGLTLNLKTIV